MILYLQLVADENSNFIPLYYYVAYFFVIWATYFSRCLQIVFTLLSSRRQNNMKRAMLSSFAPSWHEALYQRNSPPNGELKKHVEKISRFLFVGEKQERDEINRPFPSLYAAVKAAVRLS